MEQSATESNMNAGCCKIKRPSTSVVQSGSIDREEQQFVGESSELPLEQQQNVKIGTNRTPEENIERITEQSRSVLETINEDCMREIVSYLDIMDIFNLAATSKRLLQVFKDTFFTKPAKEINVYADFDNYRLITPVHAHSSLALTKKTLETAFQYFGEYVEVLGVRNVRSNKILLSCPNLKKLSLGYTIPIFNEGYARCHQNRIESLQHLKELEFYGCHGIAFHWCASAGISNVQKITLGRFEQVNVHFINYFTNLRSFTVDLHGSKLRTDDIGQIFDNNSHCLKHLIVRNITEYRAPDVIARLITEKLPELDYLELGIYLLDTSTYLCELPHLKSARLVCFENRCVFSDLRALSEKGIIEEFRLFGGVIDEGVANSQPPLNFKELRTISLWNQTKLLNTLKVFTKWKMPKIQTIILSGVETKALDGIRELFESKNTLKTIKMISYFIPLSFWRQIIDILKESSTPKRPTVRFGVRPFKFEAEVVR